MAAARPVLVGFGAPWCRPCTQMAPILAEVAREFEGRADVVEVDTSTPQGLSRALARGVTQVPTFLVEVDGEETGRVVGARPKADLRALVEEALAAPPRRD